MARNQVYIKNSKDFCNYLEESSNYYYGEIRVVHKHNAGYGLSIGAQNWDTSKRPKTRAKCPAIIISFDFDLILLSAQIAFETEEKNKLFWKFFWGQIKEEVPPEGQFKLNMDEKYYNEISDFRKKDINGLLEIVTKDRKNEKYNFEDFYTSLEITHYSSDDKDRIVDCVRAFHVVKKIEKLSLLKENYLDDLKSIYNVVEGYDVIKDMKSTITKWIKILDDTVKEFRRETGVLQVVPKLM